MVLNAILQQAGLSALMPQVSKSASSLFSTNATSPTGSTPAPTGTTGTTGTSGSSATSTNPNSTVTTNEFLQMLVTQLQNQDPTQPMDQDDMLSQLAQFSALSETSDLESTMTSASQFAGLTESASLIGKDVVTTNTDGSAGPSGLVTGVIVQDNQPYLEIGSQTVQASLVTSVSPATSSTTTSSAQMAR